MVTALRDDTTPTWRLDGRCLVVFGSFCLHDWEHLRQRQQEVVERFGERTRVYYVERHGARPLPPLKIVDAIARRLSPRKGAAPVTSVEGVEFIRAPLIPLHGIRPFDLMNARLLERRLRKALPVPLEECSAVTMYPSPYVLETVKRIPFETHVHDSVQRYEESPQVYGHRAGRIDHELAALSDVASCDSITICDDRREQGISAIRMPQGFGRRFLEPPKSSAPPTRTGGSPRPQAVIGFVGALADVVDLRLVAETARLLPDAHFVLAGPRLVGEMPPLPPNVSVSGWVPPDEVPDLIDGFDVGIVPYVSDRRTEAVLPTKLAEYLSRGLRVVATPLPDILDAARRYPSLIECACDPEGFASAIERQAARGRADARDRARVAEDLAWDTLFERYVSDIEQARSASRPRMLLVGLNYVPGWSASDKNFMRDLVKSSLAGGSHPVVAGFGGTDAVVAEGVGISRHAPVHLFRRPLHLLDRDSERSRTHSAMREYAERTMCCVALRRWLRWAAKRYRIKGVHFFDNLGPGMSFASPGLPTMLTLNASTGSHRDPARRLLWNASISRVGSVACGSARLADSIAEFSPPRVTIIPWTPSARPTHPLRPCAERREVVWSGPLQGVGEDGLAISLAAMSSALDQLPGAEVRVWPKPEFAEEIECLMRPYPGIECEVPGSAFPERLGQVRLLVSPVLSPETIVGPPLTWLEVVASGGTVVTTPCLGISDELLDSGRVVVAETGRIDDLATAIVEAWNAENDRDVRIPCLEEAARAYAEMWSET